MHLEPEFEDVGGEEGALDREMLSQGMDFPRYFHSLAYSLFL